MNTGKKPSVKYISEITGFSPATVSNALNMKRGVNKETADRILQVAEQLGYASSAKSIKFIKFVRFRRNGAIIDNSPFHPAVIEGVEEAAKANGLSTIYAGLNYDEETYQEQVRQITSDPNCGVILLATEMMEQDYDPFLESQCPIVLLDGWCERSHFNGVLIDNVDSAAYAVKYLIQKGHKKIGYIRGESRIKAFISREVGYSLALQEMGLSLNPEWTVTVGTKIESAYEGMMHWLSQKRELPTAFFADNDLIAYGAMRALKEKGLRIPQDISIVGFDDLPFSAVSTPALTTIRVHKRSMGWEAVRRMMTMLEHPNAGKFKVESCADFVERDSVKQL